MPLCNYCKKKKVNIIPFTCKCEYKSLCSKCRLPFDHNCNYDYKKEGKEILEKQLPLVVASKIDKF